MYQGPYFGATRTMVVGVQRSDNVFDATGSAIYKTTTRKTWNKVVDMPSVSGGFPISLAWYGSFAWDSRSRHVLRVEHEQPAAAPRTAAVIGGM